jgi:hypothetical protein
MHTVAPGGGSWHAAASARFQAAAGGGDDSDDEPRSKKAPSAAVKKVVAEYVQTPRSGGRQSSRVDNQQKARMSGRRYSRKALAGAAHSHPAGFGGSPARQRKRGSVSPPPKTTLSTNKRKQAVPRKGNVVECEMADPSAPGGVEWLAGEVIRVDVRKKEMTVHIQDDKEDEITSYKENYKVPCNEDVCACFLALCFCEGIQPVRSK